MRLLYPAGPSVTTNRPNKQPPDYSASPDFFVGPIGLFEIWRSAIPHTDLRKTVNILTCADSSTNTIFVFTFIRCQVSGVTYHVSHTTCHLSCVGCHLSPVTCQYRQQPQPWTLPLLTPPVCKAGCCWWFGLDPSVTSCKGQQIIDFFTEQFLTI